MELYRLATDFQALRAAHNYRDFLEQYLTLRGLTRSDLARSTGFGRGFPGDVICGRRRLTLKSFTAFDRAMKLPAAGRRLFKYLLASEEPNLFPGLDLGHLPARIVELRTKPWQVLRREASEPPNVMAAAVLRQPQAVAVFAASGEPGRGARLDEIQKRTGLSDAELTRLIRELIQSGMLRFENGLYEPSDLHLFVKTAGQSAVFARLFKEVCQQAGERAAHALAAPEEFFFTSAICVRESRLPELKAELRKTILAFVDSAVYPNGDRVVQLMTSMHR